MPRYNEVDGGLGAKACILVRELARSSVVKKRDLMIGDACVEMFVGRSDYRSSGKVFAVVAVDYFVNERKDVF